MNEDSEDFSANGRCSIWLDTILLLSVWTCAALIIHPFGNFPLNDDWSYAIAVKRWIEFGTFLPTNWTSMTLISQVIWGWLFCTILGFSFDTLRFSSWIAAFFGIIIIYHCSLRFSKNRLISLTASLIMAFNPIYFNLSLNFMTDVLSLFFNLAAVFLMMEYLTKKSDGFFILSIFISVIGVLARQNGLFVSIAFFLTGFLIHPLSFRFMIRAIFPLVASMGALVQFERWLSNSGRLPHMYGLQINIFRDILFRLQDHFIATTTWIFSNLLNQLMEIGLFLLPLTLCAAYGCFTKDRSEGRRRIPCINCMVIGFIIGLLMISQGKGFPFIGNILHKGGTGPLTLYDTYILGVPTYERLPDLLWYTVTIFSGIGTMLLLWVLFKITRDLFTTFRCKNIQSSDITTIFLLLCFLVYMAPLSFIPSFDRYLILPIALLCILASKTKLIFFSKINLNYPVAFSCCLLFFWGWYSVAGNHDYFLWNRLRWQTIDELVNAGVSLTKIDGGFEVNGYAFHDSPFNTPNDNSSPKLSTRKHPKSWWWVCDDEYVITFGTIPNTQIEKAVSFKRWLPATTGHLYVLRRIQY